MNQSSEVLQIPIEDLVPNRFQPRISFEEKALNDLANSIKQHGIIQPLVVRRLGDKYEIVAGERRYKAAQIAGLISVPALITNVNDEKSAELALVENVQRKDLSSIEEAKSYKNILDKSDMTQEELAKKMGLSQSSVANKLRLLNLSEDVQQALMEGKISERHARSLLSIEDPKTQSKLLNRVIDERLTVKQLDEEIGSLKKSNNIVDDDDVPLVDINANIDKIRSEATDINPQTENVSLENNNSNDLDQLNDSKYFDFEENKTEDADNVSNYETMSEQEANNSPESSYFEFGNNQTNEITEPSNGTLDQPNLNNSMVEEVLDVESNSNDEIDTLDDEPGISIFDEEKNVINNNTSGDLPNIINKVRDLVNSLNINNNITISEIDTEDIYKIEIDIQKNS